MANWDKLNEELDSTLDSMTQEDWIKWKNKNKMGIYRKKPVEIEAVQFNGFDTTSGQVILSERPEWLISEFGNRVLFFGEKDTLTIITLEGEHIASIGDYIIKGVKGEFYPCKPDIFELTYEMVEKTNENEKI